jgi:hypothetical protein
LAVPVEVEMRFWPGLLIAGVLAAACGGDDDGDGDGGEVVIPETTVVLDEATLDALEGVSDDLSTFTFARSTPVLDAIDPDDVIVADVHQPHLPVGALRRVERVDRAGGVVLTTAPASLADAIESGTIHETIELRAEDVASFRLPGGVHPEVGPDGLFFGLNDVVLFDGDDSDATTDDQVVMNGNVAIEPDLDFVLDLDGFSLSEASISVVGEVSGNVNIDARREATLSGEPIPLASIELVPITFFAGPVPVVITSNIDLVVGVDGKVTAKMNLGYQADIDARVGFGYANGSFGPIAEIAPTGSVELQSFDDGVAGTARLFAGPRVNIGLYGIDVGHATLKVFIEAAVDAAADPWWCLSAGLEGSAGVDIDIEVPIWILDDLISIELVDYETPPLGESVSLGCAAGPAPSSEPGGGGSGENAIRTFARTYGGDNLDQLSSILPTDDGGALLAGGTNSFSTTPLDAWLVKVDALGHVSWQLAYEDLNVATDAIDMGDGYLVTAGRLGVTVGGLTLLRLDDNGGLLWAKQIDVAGGLGPSRLVKTQDGGFLVAGTRDSTAAAEFFAIRFDAAGEVVWSNTYGGLDEDAAYAAIATSDGGFLLVGQTGSFGVTYNATWAIKLDGDGAIEWQRLFDTGGNFWGWIAMESPMGGYLIGGPTGGRGLLLRLAANGTVTWAKSYETGAVYNDLMDGAAYPDGSFGLVGQTSEAVGDWDVWVLRVSDQGNVLWSRAIGGADNDMAGGTPPYDRGGRPVAVTADGGLLVGGRTATFAVGYEDVWLLKLTKNGFIELDAGGGATSTALAGEVTNVSLPGTATSRSPQGFPVVLEDREVVLLSTPATVSRQGGLP